MQSRSKSGNKSHIVFVFFPLSYALLPKSGIDNTYLDTGTLLSRREHNLSHISFSKSAPFMCWIRRNNVWINFVNFSQYHVSTLPRYCTKFLPKNKKSTMNLHSLHSPHLSVRRTRTDVFNYTKIINFVNGWCVKLPTQFLVTFHKKRALRLFF